MKDKKYICVVCKRTFKEYIGLITHMTHLKDEKHKKYVDNLKEKIKELYEKTNYSSFEPRIFVES